MGSLLLSRLGLPTFLGDWFSSWSPNFNLVEYFKVRWLSYKLLKFILGLKHRFKLARNQSIPPFKAHILGSTSFNSAHRTGGLELALQLYIRGNSVKHAYSIPGVDVVPRFWVLMGLAHTTWARAQAQARVCKSGGPREKEFEALLLSAKNGATWSQVQWLQVQVCPLNCHFSFYFGFIFKGWTRSPLF